MTRVLLPYYKTCAKAFTKHLKLLKVKRAWILLFLKAVPWVIGTRIMMLDQVWTLAIFRTEKPRTRLMIVTYPIKATLIIRAMVEVRLRLRLFNRFSLQIHIWMQSLSILSKSKLILRISKTLISIASRNWGLLKHMNNKFSRINFSNDFMKIGIAKKLSKITLMEDCPIVYTRSSTIICLKIGMFKSTQFIKQTSECLTNLLEEE